MLGDRPPRGARPPGALTTSSPCVDLPELDITRSGRRRARRRGRRRRRELRRLDRRRRRRVPRGSRVSRERRRAGDAGPGLRRARRVAAAHLDRLRLRRRRRRPLPRGLPRCAPATAYGRTKAAGEWAVRAHLPDDVVDPAHRLALRLGRHQLRLDDAAPRRAARHRWTSSPTSWANPPGRTTWRTASSTPSRCGPRPAPTTPRPQAGRAGTGSPNGRSS